MDAVRVADFNVTLTGGDPLQQPNRAALLRLCCDLHAEGFTVWCYTGYTYEELVADGSYGSLLENIDVLVDSPFIQELRDVTLRFRGSSNQRLIDLRRSTPDDIVIWDD
jgi:anaerobic ribonucleoside-triphosphate reductase activating protein